uniref:Uncharacterized protein n=1 Tax=Brassica oleracea TaxID=3712 RepID=A0A3P6EUN8_BRAOL|nr:unnamed protein product [Brassica oleracea]
MWCQLLLTTGQSKTGPPLLLESLLQIYFLRRHSSQDRKTL